MTDDKNKTEIRKLEVILEDTWKYFEVDPPEKYSAHRKVREVGGIFCEEILNRWHKKPIGQVIHYTSIENLMSILGYADKNSAGKNTNEKMISKGKEDEKETGKGYLRLYDTVHFNDPDEGNFFVRNLPDKYNWLRREAEEITRERQECAYVASFILPREDKDMSDNLVFWREYGKQGEGCSLLLSASGSSFRKVVYGSDSVKQTLKTLDPFLEMLSCFVDRFVKHDRTRHLGKEIARAVWESLEKVRYLYKSSAYEYEEECRFITTSSEIDQQKISFVEYTDRSYIDIRHYYNHPTLEIPRLLATDSVITLGPCVPYRENIQHCLEVLLDRAELTYTEVCCSGIRYRKS